MIVTVRNRARCGSLCSSPPFLLDMLFVCCPSACSVMCRASPVPLTLLCVSLAWQFGYIFGSQVATATGSWRTAFYLETIIMFPMACILPFLQSNAVMYAHSKH